MRIKKVSQVAGLVGGVSNTYSESTIDAYACDYVNGLQTYSTDEQVVGTWIDGKPIYRKTITDTLPNAATAGTGVEKYVSLGFQIGILVQGEFIVKASAFQGTLPVFGGDNSGAGVRWYISSSNQIVIRNAQPNYNGSNVYITLYYTKATD